jgi:hypothetical protein
MTREDSGKGTWHAWVLGLIAVALALGGCGGSSDTPVTSVIDLKSPGVGANGVLKPSVFCGYGSLWVPLKWGKVPEDTKELAIYIGRFKYVKEGGTRKLVVPFADLVSRFKPTEHRLVANVLPDGISWSYFGTNCLPRKGQNILLEVFALDRIHQRAMKQSLATRLTEEALKHPRSSEGPRSPGKLTSDTAAIGRLIVTYGPPQQ